MDDLNGETAFLPGVLRRELSGAEPLIGTDGKTVLDYWSWAHSDVLENVQRGVFAEFLVAAALGITGVPRIGWAGYDLEYNSRKIEVKSTAYLQTWKQKALTRPIFLIGARQQWIEGTGSYEDPRYVADCYVFCFYEDKDAASADILDTERWLFYVVGISHLIAACGTAKTVSLERLKTITGGVPYGHLKKRTDDVLEGTRFALTAEVTPPAESPQDAGGQAKTSRSTRPYLVARRKTRAHPVIVNARNYREAHLLARANAMIASFGLDISAFELSKPRLEAALAEGAIDLRARDSTECGNPP